MQNLRKVCFTVAAIALSSLLLTPANPAAAQSSQTSNKPAKKIYGYQDPETGEFHSMQRAAKPDATAVPTTGTVELTLNIALKTPVPKGGLVVCNSTLEVDKIFSTGVYDSFDRTAAVVATVSGATATCTMTIPYSWVIAAGTPLEESFDGTYGVEIITASNVEPGLVQSADGTFASAKAVPASGTISKYIEAVTL